MLLLMSKQEENIFKLAMHLLQKLNSAFQNVYDQAYLLLLMKGFLTPDFIIILFLIVAHSPDS